MASRRRRAARAAPGSVDLLGLMAQVGRAAWREVSPAYAEARQVRGALDKAVRKGRGPFGRTDRTPQQRKEAAMAQQLQADVFGRYARLVEQEVLPAWRGPAAEFLPPAALDALKREDFAKAMLEPERLSRHAESDVKLRKLMKQWQGLTGREMTVQDLEHQSGGGLERPEALWERGRPERIIHQQRASTLA